MAFGHSVSSPVPLAGEDTSLCVKCQEVKPRAAFKQDARYRSGCVSYCRSCYQAYGRARRYGLTAEQVDEMYTDQNGQCAVCRKHLPREGKGMHIDHCHESNRVRALLCFQCNVALGQAEDDPQRLRDLADYLEAHAA